MKKIGLSEAGKQKWLRFSSKWLFPLILMVYPLLWANQGIDVSDPTYSLTNFRFFPELSGTWAIATWLANVAGFLLMKLPFGDTLLGMNLYTRLLISATALLAYFFLRGKMPSWMAFAGEIIAVSFCWCPSTILYNYLTYFLLLACCICLFRGLIWDRKGLLACAGVCLGLNVAVRTPNILEAVLILAVFWYGKLCGETSAKVWKNVLWCVCGFLAGFLAAFLAICIQYGPAAYFGMFTSLSGYAGTDESYSALSMVTSVLSAYAGTLQWVMTLVVCWLAGWIFFRFLPVRLKLAGRVVYCLCIPVLIRLFWGRGMFTFTYYNYRSIYEWGMLLLYLALAACVLVMADSRAFHRDRLLAAIILLVILVTPIGSNNGTMPALNNLFLAAPFAIWTFSGLLSRSRKHTFAFPAAALVTAVFVMTAVQGIGFRASFSFGDGIYGEKRDAKVENSAILIGMRTREENAESLSGLTAFAEEKSLSGTSLITLGSAPGLHFILDMPPGISHCWPDLDTYPAALMKEELDGLLSSPNALPAVIVYKENGELPAETEKWEYLKEYMEKGGYTLLYENGGYRVYISAQNG
ncbi:MAG TPA: hypothetical protein H9717_01840 [Candidatus Eisenbergiella merdipullorum]|uniref:Uncharacterized protein n=1 Tax=Candidatus Eisenbergiella merdipullorum TaxID=2838553 RepID=A0A9D2I4S4_9FIRM|nr:hypothetical protein [Candidatus Eisenbergiella merdipullorum]